MSHSSIVCCLLLGALLAPACSAPSGDTPAEMRAYALSTRAEALALIYDEMPELQAEVEAAAGYALFSCFSFHPGLMTFANGYGVLQDNSTDELQHMRMFRFGIGPGLSVKGYYVIVVIDDPETLAEIWDGTGIAGGFLEASFIFGDFGGESASEGTLSDRTRGYLFTHTGVALEATVAFANVSIDDGLAEEAMVEDVFEDDAATE